MARSSAEQNLRRFLPLARWLLAYVPVPLMRRAQSWAIARPLAGIHSEWISADGVRCEWLIPEGSSTDQVLLYLHGGGFVFGWADMQRQMVSQLARLSGLSALAVDYRLAPEHRFPAALEDCTTAYRWLLKQGIDPRHIVIAGDSAGGNLTLTSLIQLRDTGDPLPAAAVCLSPPTDLTVRKELEQIHDPVLHRRALYAFHDAYLADQDCTNPLVSPVFADLRGLPPLLIHVGEDELFCGDCLRLTEAAKAAGVSVRIEVYPRMWHVWQLYFAVLPQAAQALEDIAQFVAGQVGLRALAEQQA